MSNEFVDIDLSVVWEQLDEKPAKFLPLDAAFSARRSGSYQYPEITSSDHDHGAEGIVFNSHKLTGMPDASMFFTAGFLRENRKLASKETAV